MKEGIFWAWFHRYYKPRNLRSVDINVENLSSHLAIRTADIVMCDRDIDNIDQLLCPQIVSTNADIDRGMQLSLPKLEAPYSYAINGYPIQVFSRNVAYRQNFNGFSKAYLKSFTGLCILKDGEFFLDLAKHITTASPKALQSLWSRVGKENTLGCRITWMHTEQGVEQYKYTLQVTINTFPVAMPTPPELLHWSCNDVSRDTLIYTDSGVSRSRKQTKLLETTISLIQSDRQLNRGIPCQH